MDNCPSASSRQTDSPHLLHGIACAHEREIVHTDIRRGDVFFSTTMTADDIEVWMIKEPSERHAQELSNDGVLQSAVSQPLPMISEDGAMQATYLLADFRSGMRFFTQPFRLTYSQRISAQSSSLHGNRAITWLSL